MYLYEGVKFNLPYHRNPPKTILLSEEPGDCAESCILAGYLVFDKSVPRFSPPLQLTSATSTVTINMVHASTGG
jgi:hypothetical protein